MVMGMLKMQNPDEITFQSINFNFYTTSAVLQVSGESHRFGQHVVFTNRDHHSGFFLIRVARPLREQVLQCR